jgi:P27 family predicted phage terminase small subunit
MAVGRKPVPTNLRVLHGNPGKRPLNKREPEPLKPPDVPDPPAYLTGYAAEEWRRIAPELFRLGLLTIADVYPLAAYCHACGSWRAAVEALARISEKDPAFGGLMMRASNGSPIQNPLFLAVKQAGADMVRYATEFGLTPAARTRIASGVTAVTPASKFDGLIAG